MGLTKMKVVFEVNMGLTKMEVDPDGMVRDYDTSDKPLCRLKYVEERDLDSFCGGQADTAACAVVGHYGHTDEVVAASHSDQVYEGVHAAGEAEGLGDQVAAVVQGNEGVHVEEHLLDQGCVSRVGGNGVKESFNFCT